MALTFEEYKELRLSGLSAQQIKRMDEPNQRAMLRGYQRGQEAMSQGSVDAPESTISAPPESEAMFSEEPRQMGMGDYWNTAMGSIPGSGGLIPATSLPSSGQILGTGLALAPMIGTGMKIGGGIAALAKGAGSGALRTAVGGAVKEAAIEAVLNRLPPEVAIAIRAAMGARRGAKGAAKVPAAAKAAEEVAEEGGSAASKAGRELARKRWGGKPKLEVVEGKTAGQQRIAKLKEGESAPGRAKRLKQRQKDNRRHPQMQQQPQIEPPPLGGELRRAIEAEKWMIKNGVTPEQRIEILRRLAQGE